MAIHTKFKVEYTVKAKGHTFIYAKDEATAKELFDPDWITVDENNLYDIEMEVQEVSGE